MFNLREVGICHVATEIARAFNVPVVLSVHSKWIGNGFTVDECNRLMGFKADNVDPLRVLEGITITLDPDTGEGIVPLDNVIHGYNIYKYQYDNGYWD